MKLRIKSTPTTIISIAIYQILGGLVGLGLVSWLLVRTQELNGVLLFIFLISIGLFCLSIKAGSALINKQYKKGLIYSIICQIFQVVAFAVGGYKYDFFSGGRFSAGFNFTDGFTLKFDFALMSSFNMSYNSGTEYYMYINFVAIFLIYVLLDIYDEMYGKKKSSIYDKNLNHLEASQNGSYEI